MRLAVFDLDKTLLPLDCSWCFVGWVIEAEGLDPEPIRKEMTRIYDEYARNRLDFNDVTRFMSAFLAMTPRARLDALQEEFMRVWIKPNLPRAALEAVHRHQMAGDEVVICSGSSSYVARPIVRLFGVEHLLCWHAETDADGEFTGRAATGHSCAQAKVALVQDFVSRSGQQLETVTVYSDSISDIPLFEFALRHGGRCIAVNPDRLLSQEAPRRGWPVERFYTEQDVQRARRPTVVATKEV